MELMKIKILHILHSLQIGGLENGVVNLINNLNSERFEHAICCIDSSGPMAERINRPVEIFSLDKGEKRDYLLPIKITGIINEVRPDIVHTRNWGAVDGILGAKFAGIKYIIHGEHGREASDPEGRNGKRKRIRKALSPWISQFVAVSRELNDWLIHDVGISSKKVIQIINGVDTEIIKPTMSKTELKSEIGLSPDTFVIGSVGRLDPVKDHETLLKAFAGAVKKHCDRKMALIIAGSGPLKNKLIATAGKLNIGHNVIFTGERDDIIQLYNCMDIYVLPSIAEGISNTILEAMASGLPVLASNVGGNLELIDQNRNGFFFFPGNREELASLIGRYVDNYSLVTEHGSNSRQRALNNFSLHYMTERYGDLYQSFFRSKHLSEAL